MTILQAYKAALAPYTLPTQTIEFLLIKQGLDMSDDYDNSIEKELYKAVIDGLYQLISLTKEKDPGTEYNYDVNSLLELIKRYEDKYGEDEDCFIDRSDDIWN